MSDSDSTITRRTVLETGAIVGVAGLAGCSSEQPPEENTTTTAESDSADTETTENTDEQEEKPEETEEPVENELQLLHSWTWGANNEAITALIDGFQSEYSSVDVSTDTVQGSLYDVNQEVTERLADNDPPSTFQAWPGKTLEMFADNLGDISENIWAGDLTENSVASVQELVQQSGNYVAVPVNVHRVNNLFYNTAVVESAGVDPETLQTPSDLVDACETIAQETDAVPFSHQTNSSWSTVQLWETILLAQSGVDGYEAFINGTADSKQVESALQNIEALSEYYSNYAGASDFAESNQLVIDGEAAFINQGDWAESSFVAEENFSYGSDWDHVAYPGTSDQYLLTMDSFPYLADNPSPEATERFLTYCGTPDGQIRFSQKKGSVPSRTDADVSTLPQFQQDQYAAFRQASAHPPSIQHGMAVSTAVRRDINDIFGTFIDRYNVSETASSLLSAVN